MSQGISFRASFGERTLIPLTGGKCFWFDVMIALAFPAIAAAKKISSAGSGEISTEYQGWTSTPPRRNDAILVAGMGGPDPEAVEHLLVLVEDIFGQDEIEGALLAIQPSFEEKARGVVRYGLLFSGGREERLDPPHENARVQDVAVALISP